MELFVIFLDYPLNVHGISSDHASFILNFFLGQSGQRLVNIIDFPLKEPVFGFVDFLYCLSDSDLTYIYSNFCYYFCLLF